MTLGRAIAADRDDLVVEAASLYEAELRSSSEIDAFVNLAVLYWQSTDYGFWTAHALPRDFVTLAATRFPEILDEAARHFPQRLEPWFWKKYIGWADIGESFEPDECRSALQADPNYLEPAMFLFATSEGSQCKTEALELLARYSEAGTCRARYVASVIEAVIQRSSRLNQ